MYISTTLIRFNYFDNYIKNVVFIHAIFFVLPVFRNILKNVVTPPIDLIRSYLYKHYPGRVVYIYEQRK